MFCLENHIGSVHLLAFSPDGSMLVSGSRDNTVRLWDPPFARGIVWWGVPYSLAFSSGSDMLYIGESGQVRIFNLSTEPPSVHGNVSFPFEPITGLVVYHHAPLLGVGLGDPRKTLTRPHASCLFNLSTAKHQSIPLDKACTTSGVRAMAGNTDHRLLAWATDNRVVVVWNLSKPDPIRFNLGSTARSIAISPDGKQLAVALDWNIALFDLESRSPRTVLEGHVGVVSSIAFAPDSQTLMSGSWDKTVRYWDVRTCREKISYAWPTGRVYAVCFAPDGLRAAAAGDEGSIVVWDVEE